MTEPQPSSSESSIPANANTECVGPTSKSAGKASACEGCPNQSACASGAFSSPEAQAQAAAEVTALQASLSKVAHVILVLSGKGGVGKSTVAAQLAHTLADENSGNYAVGLLDVDLCGPSAPRMMLGDASLHQTVQKSSSGHWIPVYTASNHNPIAVMSISFLLENANQAVVWRGPRKNALIQQFLTQVDWTGDTDGLDYLIIDTPPGTSDEHISTVQYLQKVTQHAPLASAIVVTTPEEVSLADVRKELNFCQKTKVPVLGVVENMGTYQASFQDVQFVNKKDGSDCTAAVLQTLQEKCPEVLEQYCISSQLFSDHHVGGGMGGAEQMAADYNVPFWGRLPLDPQLLQACEKGQAYVAVQPEAPAAQALQEMARKLTTALPVAMAEDETME